MAGRVTSQNVREEERSFGIAYERAVPMVPRTLRAVTGIAPTEVGDGYFTVEMGKGNGRRQITLRLGRESADTRILIRVETFIDVKVILSVVALGIVTAGIGVLPLIPWLSALTRKQAQDREVLLHRIFRALEDAVAEQGASNHYRIAPGADEMRASVEQSGEHPLEEGRRRRA